MVNIASQQILNVGGCLLVQSLESEKQNFEFNTLIYTKPVQIAQNWSEVVVYARESNQVGGSILYRLQLELLHNVLRHIIQNRVAVAKLEIQKHGQESRWSSRIRISYAGNVTQIQQKADLQTELIRGSIDIVLSKNGTDFPGRTG